MQASVVISYYKNLPNLELILMGLQQQTAKGNFEVIISEDDNATESVQFINSIQNKLSFPLKHLSQDNAGFRKCMAMNKAVLAAAADFIIFLDGDCIPHRQLVKQYIHKKKYGRVLYGRRVTLSKKLSAQLLKKKDLGTLNIFRLLLSGCRRIEEGFYLPIIPQRYIEKKEARLLGCNMGIYKEDLIAINGFDEDYNFPGGGEDSDIEWRLEKLNNTAFYSMKFKAIVYHIWHQERFTKEAGAKSYNALMNKITLGFYVCKNGIKKLYHG